MHLTLQYRIDRVGILSFRLGGITSLTYQLPHTSSPVTSRARRSAVANPTALSFHDVRELGWHFHLLLPLLHLLQVHVAGVLLVVPSFA